MAGKRGAGDPSVSIRVLLVDTPVHEALKKMTKAFKKNALDINASLELVGKAINGIVAPIMAVTHQVEKWIEQAKEQEKVEKKLVAGLRLRGDLTGKNVKELDKFNNSLQEQTGYSKRALMEMEAGLLALDVMPSKLKEAAKATLVLAEVEGIDLHRAMRDVGRATHDNLMAIRRLGINAKDGAEALKFLGSMWEFVAAQSGTFETKMKILESTMDRLETTLGEAFTQADESKELVDALTFAMRDLISIFSGEEGKNQVREWIKLFAGLASSTLAAYLGARKLTVDSGLFSDLPGTKSSGMTGLITQMVLKKAIVDKTGKTLSELEKDPFVEMMSNLQERLMAIANKPEAQGEDLAPPVHVGDVFGSGAMHMPGKPKKEKKLRGHNLAYYNALGYKKLMQEEFDITIKHYHDMADLDKQRLIQQREDVDARNAALVEDLEDQRDIFSKAFDLSVNEFERQQQLHDRWQQDLAEFGNIVINGIANMVAGIVEAVISGEQDVLAAAGSLFAALLKQIGQTMIQMATIWGILAAITLDPVLAARAGALLAAGIASLALASAISPSQKGGGRGGSGAGGNGLSSAYDDDTYQRWDPARRGFTRTDSSGAYGVVSGPTRRGGLHGAGPNRFGPGRESGAPEGFVSRESGTIVNNYSINFGPGFFTGSPASVGRQIQRALDEANRLGGGNRWNRN